MVKRLYQSLQLFNPDPQMCLEWRCCKVHWTFPWKTKRSQAFQVAIFAVSHERNEFAVKFQRLPPHFGHGRLTGTSPEIVRCRPATGNSNGGQLTGSSYISGTGCDSSEISTAIPTFSAVADSMELVPTLCDVGRHPQIAMTGTAWDISEISTDTGNFYHAP